MCCPVPCERHFFFSLSQNARWAIRNWTPASHKQGMVVHSCNPSWKQEDQEFKVSWLPTQQVQGICYTWDTWEPVLKSLFFFSYVAHLHALLLKIKQRRVYKYMKIGTPNTPGLLYSKVGSFSVSNPKIFPMLSLIVCLPHAQAEALPVIRW